MITPVTTAALRVGVDLGGTKTEIIALDPAGRTLLRRREPTPQADYAATLALVTRMVREAEAQLGCAAIVGVGIPGAESLETGLVKNANSTCLIGRSFRADLEALLGRSVRVANDANCFALSEAVDGAGYGARCVFGVILGTGVGAGIVIEGRLLTGANAIAGEWGHNPLPLPGAPDLPLPACYCGRHGCIETYLSGPALAAEHARRSGRSMTAQEVFAAAASGDAACEETLQAYEERLARALAGVINLLDPDVIVLGGGLSNLQRLYRNVPVLWRRLVFSDSVRTRLLPNRHGDSGGVRGAAWLWGGPPCAG